MDEINLVEEDLWDHYSGLPSPAWYEYKKKIRNEEDSTDIDINIEHIPTEVQT